MRSSGLGWVPVVLGLLFVAAGLYHFGASSKVEDTGDSEFDEAVLLHESIGDPHATQHTKYQVKLPNGPIAALPAGGFSAGPDREFPIVPAARTEACSTRDNHALGHLLHLPTRRFSPAADCAETEAHCSCPCSILFFLCGCGREHQKNWSDPCRDNASPTVVSFGSVAR